jgi:hypothetical protein
MYKDIIQTLSHIAKIEGSFRLHGGCSLGIEKFVEQNMCITRPKAVPARIHRHDDPQNCQKDACVEPEVRFCSLRKPRVALWMRPGHRVYRWGEY